MDDEEEHLFNSAAPPTATLLSSSTNTESGPMPSGVPLLSSSSTATTTMGGRRLLLKRRRSGSTEVTPPTAAEDREISAAPALVTRPSSSSSAAAFEWESRYCTSFIDRVVPCSLVPILPCRHSHFRLAVAAVPVLDAASISRDVRIALVEDERLRRSSESDWLRGRFGLIHTANGGGSAKPLEGEEDDDVQLLLSAALRQFSCSVAQGAWNPVGVATVEWSDGTFGCTTDVEGLAQELALRLSFQALLPPGQVGARPPKSSLLLPQSESLVTQCFPYRGDGLIVSDEGLKDLVRKAATDGRHKGRMNCACGSAAPKKLLQVQSALGDAKPTAATGNVFEKGNSSSSNSSAALTSSGEDNEHGRDRLQSAKSSLSPSVAFARPSPPSTVPAATSSASELSTPRLRLAPAAQSGGPTCGDPLAGGNLDGGKEVAEATVSTAASPRGRLCSGCSSSSLSSSPLRRQALPWEVCAALQTVTRLRTAHTVIGPSRVTFCRVRDFREGDRGSAGGGEGAAVGVNAGCDPVVMPTEFLDAALRFCVEQTSNPYLTCLLTLSQLLPRMTSTAPDGDVSCSVGELMSKLLDALVPHTVSRVVSMHEVVRVEQTIGTVGPKDVEDARRHAAMLVHTPLATDVARALASLPLFSDAFRDVCAERGGFDSSADRFEWNVVQQSGVLEMIATDGDRTVALVRNFLRQNGRTVRGRELVSLVGTTPSSDRLRVR